MNYQAMGRMLKKSVGVGVYMLGAIGRAADSVRLYNELERMDDDELAARGISRARIGRFVAESMDPATLTSFSAPRTLDVPSVLEESDVALQRRAA